MEILYNKWKYKIITVKIILIFLINFVILQFYLVKNNFYQNL
jgi:hypothetical protein